MVQVSTIYDTINNLNEKVFLIRGDEGYARNTRIEITRANSYEDNITSYDELLVVNVYGAVGNSNLIIKGGDDTIAVVEYEAQEDFECYVEGLSYDVMHNISIIFEGNTQCLKSHSNTLSFCRENVNLTSTVITTTDDRASFNTHTITLSATLEHDSTGLSGKTLKWYVDGFYKNSAQTNSSGYATCTISDVTNGTHLVEVVFDGDETYKKSIIHHGVAIGRKLKIIEYPPIFLNGEDNTVKVKLTDYYDNPIALENVTFNGTIGTTDSSGIATLNITQVINNHEYYAEQGDYTSDPITVYASEITSIQIRSDMAFVPKTKKTTVTARLEGTNIMEGTPVTFDGGLTGLYYTDARGEVSAEYLGTGVGNISITAKCRSFSNSITIEDLEQYWKPTTGYQYALATTLQGSIKQLTNGWRFNIPANGTCIVGFGDRSNGTIGDYEITFDNVYEQTYIKFHVGAWRNNTWAKSDDYFDLEEKYFGAGYKFRIRKIGNTVTISHGNTVYWQYTLNNNNYPCFMFSSSRSGISNRVIVVNNLKFRRI